MYGNTAPPKKYSTPRGVAENSCSERLCQKCASKAHWTYECKDSSQTSRLMTTRPSRTQMLRWGIKQRRQEFVPEPTEKEAYTSQMKNVERLLLAEAREEVQQKRRIEESWSVKKEKNSEVVKEERKKDDDGEE